jgi:peptidoglycan/xylan/chitin deacetylase (PgdA/CDA1 family)
MSWRFSPVAMFHHVSDRKDWDSLRPYVIREATFLEFLSTVQKRGMRTVTFQKLFEERRSPARNELIITFDDCGKHLLDFVVPELEKRAMSAVFFMPTAHLGGTNEWDVLEGRAELELMNASDLFKLHNRGMEVGGHSHHHLHLGRMSRNECADELRQSQQELTQAIGKQAVSMAYPFGSIPTAAESLLSEAGFAVGCSIFSPSAHHWQLRRFIVHDGDSPKALSVKLSALYGGYRSIRDSFKAKTAFR